MNLAAVLIPTSLDAKQALRLRRFGLGALTYALSTVLVAIAWVFGVIPASAALESASPFQLGSQKQGVHIGASIGIALYPADAQDPDALVKAADAAMYRAKQAGSRIISYAA